MKIKEEEENKEWENYILKLNLSMDVAVRIDG
jgi:hypothetical protein